jgi:hypothetical protein
MLQGMDPSGDSGVYGMLGYKERGGGLGGDFQPTISPDQMNDVYGLLAQYSDDPTNVGLNYVKSMQNNDTLRAANKDAKYRMTDAMRPKPVGSGYEDADGYQVQPIWDPNFNNGRGGMREERIGRRKTNTITIAGISYQRNPFQPNPNAPDYWMPSVAPQTVGENAAVVDRLKARGGKLGMDQAEAEEVMGGLIAQDMEIQRIINNPNFDASVGWLDQITGKFGAQIGTDEGILMKDAEKVSNALTTAKVSVWKGAISNAELNFFKSSVPQVGDGPEVWRSWYVNQYIPFKEFISMRARGEIELANSDLSVYIQSAQTKFLESDDAVNDPLVLKYLEQ